MPYIIQTASAKMPSSCKGRYKRIAVIEVESGFESVSSISDLAKGVIRIVETWEKLSVGTTPKSAYHRAMTEAQTLLARLNDGCPR